MKQRSKQQQNQWKLENDLFRRFTIYEMPFFYLYIVEYFS